MCQLPKCASPSVTDLTDVPQAHPLVTTTYSTWSDLNASAQVPSQAVLQGNFSLEYIMTEVLSLYHCRLQWFTVMGSGSTINSYLLL